MENLSDYVPFDDFMKTEFAKKASKEEKKKVVENIAQTRQRLNPAFDKYYDLTNPGNIAIEKSENKPIAKRKIKFYEGGGAHPTTLSEFLDQLKTRLKYGYQSFKVYDLLETLSGGKKK